MQDITATIMAHLEALIDKRVEEKVAEIMQSTATLALISQEQTEIMKSLIDDHENNNDHSRDDFITSDDMHEAVNEAVNDIDMEDKLQQAIRHTNIIEDIVDSRIEEFDFGEKVVDAIDEIDWEEKVRQGLTSILG